MGLANLISWFRTSKHTPPSGNRYATQAQLDQHWQQRDRERLLMEQVAATPPYELVNPWATMFDGLKLLFPLFPVRFDYRYSNSYIWLTQSQLDLFRAYARWLYEVNPYAQGGLECLADYTIGTGFVPYVQAKRYGPQVPESLKHLCMKHLEDVLNKNCWWRMERESFKRQKRDGDVFIRLFPQDDGIPKLRFIEPEQIRNPSTTLEDYSNSFGVVTDPEDRVDVKGFQVWYAQDDPEGEFVPVEECVYWTNHMDMNVKRGLSDFFVLQDILDDAGKLLRAGRQGEAVRQAIAYIRQWAMANQPTIQSLQATNTDYQVPKYEIPTTAFTSQPLEQVTNVMPGEVHDVPQDMEFVNPPIGNGQNFELTLHATLKAAAVKWRVPSWVLTADSADANFAAALVAESPMVKARQWDQKCALKQFQRVWHQILHCAELQGILPEDTCEKVEVCAEPLPIATRNAKEETDRNQVLFDKGILSMRTWAAREDLDFDEEQENKKEEPQTQMNGMGLDANHPPSTPSNTAGAEYQRQVNR